MIWLLLYLSPLSLLFFFEIYAFCKAQEWTWLEYAAGLLGLLPDIVSNYTVFSAWYGQWPRAKAYTVSKQTEFLARDGNQKALRLATYLNKRDPNHIKVEQV